MKIYVANFGTQNWAWKDCLRQSSIAVMDEIRVHQFWKRGDRDGYIAEAQRTHRDKEGRPVTKAVASRWFNLNTLLMESVDDLWIHRAEDYLWWTMSLDQVPQSEIVIDPIHPVKEFVYHKGCNKWSSKDKKGASLRWLAIHPKARQFLVTKGTFQQLSSDNALYAQALISGGDLSAWHSRSDWRAKETPAYLEATKVNPWELSAHRMAHTAWQTIAQSGQVSLAVKKDKRGLFATERDLELYVRGLTKMQGGLCALTGIRMLLDGIDGDSDLRCSLDRIDSSGHYERGNLQVVCWFANRWKAASDNAKFKGLIEVIRNGQSNTKSAPKG